MFGTCPPRSLSIDRSMAQHRTAPYGLRAPSTVARGPVPRDRSIHTKNARSPRTSAIFSADRCMARHRTAPYGLRPPSTVARGPVPRDRPNHTNPPLTVARGPVPRDLPTYTKNARSPRTSGLFSADRCMARHRTAPYGLRAPFNRRALFTVARGPVPRDRSTTPKTPEAPGLLCRSMHGAAQDRALR